MAHPINGNRALMKELKRRGWSASLTKKGHVKLVHAEMGKTIFHSGTPSDHRANKNLMSDITKCERSHQCRKRRA